MLNRNNYNIGFDLNIVNSTPDAGIPNISSHEFIKVFCILIFSSLDVIYSYYNKNNNNYYFDSNPSVADSCKEFEIISSLRVLD